jgi:hypothetical protein
VSSGPPIFTPFGGSKPPRMHPRRLMPNGLAR